MNLSKRLTRIRDFSHDSQTIWDIGCDHGLLGLSFQADPKVKAINLVDPSEAVIKKLDSYITTDEKIKIWHAKGQNIVLSPEKKTVFIAGMGGKEIIDILKHLEPQLTEKDSLVISPHRKILEIRQWLMLSQLGLFHEEVLVEDGQYYLILVLRKDAILERVTAYGDSLWKGSVGQEYLNHQILHFSRHEDQASIEYVTYLKERKLPN
ncbi:MAG TPA: tRNA (adenine(22)-N(1))-methyltransferase TrmK [Bacteriovoracaceae bacterium]|nr:tRNA (adenine(22)-N(1))-methyltransferase TrmK [Bacteriovoracaceae bacterium]